MCLFVCMCVCGGGGGVDGNLFTCYCKKEQKERKHPLSVLSFALSLVDLMSHRGNERFIGLQHLNRLPQKSVICSFSLHFVLEKNTYVCDKCGSAIVLKTGKGEGCEVNIDSFFGRSECHLEGGGIDTVSSFGLKDSDTDRQ